MPINANMKYVRYTLAALCFATSVGCLLLWWRSYAYRDMAFGPSPQRPRIIYMETFRGSFAVAYLVPATPRYGVVTTIPTWQLSSEAMPSNFEFIDARRTPVEYFGRTTRGGYYFPLWYPALIFALAGVGILRFGRFTIRSALIGTTIVAVLLGMVVVL